MKVEFANAKMELVTIDGEVQVLGRNTAVKLLLSSQPNRWVDRQIGRDEESEIEMERRTR